jgi:hypothetical protein
MEHVILLQSRAICARILAVTIILLMYPCGKVHESPRVSITHAAPRYYARLSAYYPLLAREVLIAHTRANVCLFITLYKAPTRFRIETTRLRLNLRVCARFKVTTIVQLIIGKTVGGQRNIHTGASKITVHTFRHTVWLFHFVTRVYA